MNVANYLKTADQDLIERGAKFIPWGVRLLRNMGLSREDAEDLAHEVLYKVAARYKQSKAPNEDDTLHVYYYTAIKLNVANLRKARNNRANMQGRYRDQCMIHSHPKTHRQSQMKHDIDWLMEQIPEKSSNYMRKIYVYGYKYRDLAKELGVHHSNISQWIYKTYPTLREAWINEFGDSKTWAY